MPKYRPYSWTRISADNLDAPKRECLDRSMDMVSSIPSGWKRWETSISHRVVRSSRGSVFGLSTTFWLSFAALFTLGAADAFSMFIRSNLVQIDTPDETRGRVSAVNSIFIGASNELGQFESGVTAAWWGVVPAVLVGGIGTIAVAVVFAFVFPALRRVDSLDPDDLVRRYRDLPGRAPAETE